MHVKVKFLYFWPLKVGALAQLVEQWTENPCVPGSIPGGTTKSSIICCFFVFIYDSYYATHKK